MKVTFCKTIAGNGFKIIVDNNWLYTSKDKLLAVINDEARSCQFRPMESSDNSSDQDESVSDFEDPFDETSESQ